MGKGNGGVRQSGQGCGAKEDCVGSCRIRTGSADGETERKEGRAKSGEYMYTGSLLLYIKNTCNVQVHVHVLQEFLYFQLCYMYSIDKFNN